MLWDDTASGPGGPFDIPRDATPALHWDGTYRDRVWSLEDTFWTEEDYEGDLNRPTPSREIAKHLA